MDIGSLTQDLQEVRQKGIATEEKLDSFMKDFKHFVQEHFHPLQSALSCKRCHCYSDSDSSLPSPISPIRPNSESGGPARAVLIRFTPNLVGYDLSSPTSSGSRRSSSFVTLPSLISVSSSGEGKEGREGTVDRSVGPEGEDAEERSGEVVSATSSEGSGGEFWELCGSNGVREDSV